MYNLRVLIVSVILSASLSELPETFTLVIKLNLWKIKAEKLKMIVFVLIEKIYIKKFSLNKSNNRTTKN